MKLSDFNNGNNFIIFATIISILLAKMLNDEEQNLIGNFLQSVGANITTIAAFNEYIQAIESKSTTKVEDTSDNKESGKC